MTWSARIEHTPTGIALTFGAPLSRLDMAPDVAQHLASLLAVEAQHRLAGVVAVLAAQDSRHGDTPAIAGNLGSSAAHPPCCDCSPCLNGDHDV